MLELVIQIFHQAICIILGGKDSLYTISQAAGSTLVTAIWQGALVAACLELALRLAPRTAAAHRFAIWAAGFAVLVALPCLPMLTHATVAVAASSTSGPLPVAHSWLHIDIRWSIVLTAIWIAASLYRATDLAIHTLRLRRLWKSATPVLLDPEHETALGVSQPVLGRRVELCTTTELERPSVIGFFAPRILVPEWLYSQLTPAELSQIVLHETEHLRRIDDWTNLIQKLCLVLFPLNPVLLWVERRLCIEREMACDDGVVEKTHAPNDYAVCLTNLAERRLQHRVESSSLGTLSLGAWQRRSELVRRVHSILLRKPTLQPLAARSLFALLGGVLVFGSVELSRCPQLIAFTSTTSADHQNIASVSPPGGRNFAAAESMAANSSLADLSHSSGFSYSRPYLTQLKAEVPAQPTRRPQTAALVRRPCMAAPPLAIQAKALNHTGLAAHASTPLTVAAADTVLPTQMAIDASSVHHFVLLSSWQEFEPLSQQVQDGRPEQQYNQHSPQDQFNQRSRLTQPISDTAIYEGAAPIVARPPASSQAPVTRLVFRVATPDFDPSFPAVTIRTGWLIIQL